MKNNELRNKNTDELQSELLASLKEQFNLRMQVGAGEPPKSHHFKRVRRYVARIKTIMNEKEKGSTI